MKLRGDGPQAVFLKLTGDDTYVKCFDLHLKGLQKVEGLSKEEYNAKAEEMSRKAPNKDDDKLETQKAMYNPSRFEMQRMHVTRSVDLLTDP